MRHPGQMLSGLPSVAPTLLKGLGEGDPMNRSRPFASALLLFSTFAAAPLACAPAYPPTVGGYATAYADDVPVDIYAYPHVYFSGGYAYLVRDRWYYPSEGRWVMLRTEPPQLYRYRSTYRQQAPPAYAPGYEPYYRRNEQGPYVPPAPPAPYAYPPPANRVR
jgi:hypothetical protein